MTSVQEQFATDDTLTAPIFLVRVAGLPLAVSSGREFDGLERLLEERASSTAQLERLSDELSDRLFEVIARSKLEGGPTRPLIQLRRDAHNRRLSSAMGRSAEWFLTAAERLALRRVCYAHDRMAALDAEIEAKLGVGLTERQNRLLELARDEEFMDGVALASPTLARFVGEVDFRADRKKLEGTLKALSSYAARASRKTSPFSTFTTVSLGHHGASVVDGAPTADEQRIVTVSKALLQTLLRAASAYEECGQFLQVAPIEGIVGTPHAEAGFGAFVARPVVYDGFFFAEDEILDVWGDDVLHLGFTKPSTMTNLRRDTGLDHASVSRIATSGLLRITPPAGGIRDLAASAADALGDKHPFAVALHAVQANVRALAEEHGPDRAIAVDGLRSEALHAVKTAGLTPPDWMTTAHLSHETRATPPDRLAPKEDVDLARPVRVLSEILAPTIGVSHVYSSLVDTFLKMGGGSSPMPMLEFVAGTLRSEAFRSAHAAAGSADFARMPNSHPLVLEGRAPGGHGTVSPPTFSAFLQFLDTKSLNAQEPRVVVNRVNQGVGGLLLRWAKLPTLHGELSDGIRDWLDRLHPGVQVAASTTGDSWSDVQELPRDSVAALGWPTQTPGRDSPDLVLPAAELLMSYDADTHTLQLTDRRTGRPVAIPYLGIVPPHMLQGASRIIQTLSDPWTFDHLLGMERTASWWWPSAPTEHLSRVTVDGVVLRREAWLAASRTLPQDLLDPRKARAASTIVAVDEWRREHGLPRFVFVRAGRDQLATAPPKPQFVDLIDPLTLGVLSAIVRAHDWVTLEEALPGADDADIDAGRRASEVMSVFALIDGRNQ